MKKEMMKCLLRIVSPVHVGCDEVYEPTGFSVNENDNHLTIFDPLKFIGGLEPADKERLSAICKKGDISSILDVYKFLRNRPVQGRTVQVCKDFQKHYEQVLSLAKQNVKQELNKFTVYRTVFLSQDERPYIPGSSIKGALRTAYLNMLSSNGPDHTSYLKGSSRGKGARDDKHKKLEQKLLDLDKVPHKEMLSKDPFRLVKVSDFMPVGDVPAKIFYVVNKKKRPSDKDARGPYQILETILPGAFFTGEITVDAPQTADAVSLPITLENLLQSIGLFYGNEKKREDLELRNIGVPLLEAGGEKGRHIIRIGRHSGAESVTIEKYRDIKIMLGKKGNAFQNHATTLWLASEFRNPSSNGSLSPFGWAELDHISPDMEDKFIAEEKSFKQKRLQMLHAAEKEAAEREKEQAEQERLREEEQKRLEEKRLAEEEEKRRLATMSPVDRSIYDLQQTDIPEHRVIEIYSTLDNLSQEDKVRLSRALKNYWEENGKWAKKSCSKKQWTKVQKIKGILGE